MTATLPEWLEPALPQHLRGRVRLRPGPRRAGELTLIFELPGQPARTLDIYRMGPGLRALKQFGEIGFAYRAESGSVDHRAESEFCVAVATALMRTAGEQLLAHLCEPISEPRERTIPSPLDGARVVLDEFTLRRVGIHSSLSKLRAISGPICDVEVWLVASCVQSCSFCVYPHVRKAGLAHAPSPDAIAWLRGILDELRNRTTPSQVVLSGPDCLRHPQIDAMLDLFADERDIGLQLLGPLTRLSEPALFERVAALPTLRGVRMSLFGARAETHDRIVGAAGAHAQVMAVLRQCRAREIPINLHCVVTPENVDELPELLAMLRELGQHVEFCVYHPESWSGTPLTWREVSMERTVVHPDRLLAALGRTPERTAAHGRSLYIAHCWIPARLRERMLDDPHDLQDNFAFAPACEQCSARPRCPGISRPALERFGPGCARAIT